MDKRFVIIFLIFFITGMTLGCVSASHTYTKGKYSFTVSDGQYNKIKSVKKNNKGSVNYKIKTKYTVKAKVPTYKNKKVTKYKWKYKSVWTCSDYFDKYGNWLQYKDRTSISKYLNSGWKYHSSYVVKAKYGSDGSISKYHVKLKKKVPYTTTKKVKSGYKTVKMPVYAVISTYSGLRWVDDYNYYEVNYPQVQFIAMKQGCPNQYVTVHYNL